MTLGILTPTEALTNVELETVPGDERKVKEAKVQGQASQKLPKEIQALVDEARVVSRYSRLKIYNSCWGITGTSSPLRLSLWTVRHWSAQIRNTIDPIKSQYQLIPVGLREEAIKEEKAMKKLGVTES